MEKQIRKIVFRLKLDFTIFWMLPMCGIVVGETGNEWVGSCAGEVLFTYYIETFCILLTAICVPLSLKIFASQLKHKIDKERLPEALSLYRNWSLYRLLLLSLPVLTGVTLYYLTMSNTGMLCASISLVASLFCWPSENRMRKELHISISEE